jgi:hypothetical protein
MLTESNPNLDLRLLNLHQFPKERVYELVGETGCSLNDLINEALESLLLLEVRSLPLDLVLLTSQNFNTRHLPSYDPL